MYIRKITRSDESQMLELMDEFWMKHHRGELLQGDLKDMAMFKDASAQMKIELAEYYDLPCYVAIMESELVGFVVGRVSMEHDRVLDKVGIIEELFVTEKARGQRLGQLLMEKIMEVLASEGCVVYRVTAYANNKEALALYRKMGFMDEAVELSRKA